MVSILFIAQLMRAQKIKFREEVGVIVEVLVDILTVHKNLLVFDGLVVENLVVFGVCDEVMGQHLRC
jgi:hypothetical protein